MTFDPTEPFVLLDDARQGGSAILFTRPRFFTSATAADDVKPALDRIRATAHAGLWAAGFMSYEAGYVVEPKLRRHFRQPRENFPLVWFGAFEQRHRLTYAEVESLLGDSSSIVGALHPHADNMRHSEMVRTVQDLIAAGDIYQANITFQADIGFDGHPLAVYRRLRSAQAAPYSALIHTGADWALSFSPELFFQLQNGRLTTRPMKGTAPRGQSLAEDRSNAQALAADPKNRAENLMIVDLLRNDLSRVSEAGSVKVTDLFRVDTYPTIHQMTTTIAAALDKDKDAVDVLRMLFPCGSVTGAPKIRAMEVIADTESEPRGLYTGSIGYIDPDGSATFNVAIRTLLVSDTGRATLGLGSGIVADSTAAAEWRECLDKAAFLTRSARRFDLIETLRFTPEDGLVRLERHLDRLAASAAYWGFVLDDREVRNAIATTVDQVEGPSRIRVLVGPDGKVAVQASPLPANPASPVEVTTVRLPVASNDPRLFHKTTDRAFYDEARASNGTFEVLFVNERGELTEGSFTSVFVPQNGKLLTPPLTAGLLPGVLRAELIETGQAVEAPLTPADLRDEFFIGNSLRGLMRARLRQ